MRSLLVSDYRPATARDRHDDALASLRAMSTPVLLGELAEFRRDARRTCPPMRWLDGAMGAMRCRRVLREREEGA